MANSSIDLTSLDVPTLEQSLRDYMSAQSAFRDYDWEGSNLSALIRLLALNTAKNSWYLHMTMSEGFLDSAQTRSSVLSHAKELNYQPRSARSAVSTVRVSFTGPDSTYVIDKGQTFSSTIKNRGLVFSVPEAVLVSSSNGSFTFVTDLYEGRYTKDAYVLDESDETQRLLLTNPDVDTRSLVVVVYEDGSSAGQVYTQATSLLGITSTSKVYFLQASELGDYEVIFGDGVLGFKPADGSSVILDYRTTLGADGNGAKIFARDFSLGEGVGNVSVTTLSDSTDGAAPESIESIKYYAPRHFQVQERAVTATDYSILLKTQFPEIRAVSAYGGEDADPPQYGRVIVAVDLSDIDGIPESKKTEYKNFLSARAGLTVEAVIVEPQYSYVAIDSEVLYNINVSTLSPTSIEALVVNAVLAYADENLDDFDTTVRYSRIVTLIDSAHRSIVGNQTILEVYKKVEVDSGSSVTFTLSFGFPLLTPDSEDGRGQRTLRSGIFRVKADTRYLVDDSAGGVWTATDRGGQRVLVQRVGTIDYKAGVVKVSNLGVDQIDGTDLKVYVHPQVMDVTVTGDTILGVEADEIQVTVTAVRE